MADDDLPIDVHYDKLIDWLVDRKKVSKDWRKKLAGVHAKLSELARELPGALTRARGLGVRLGPVVGDALVDVVAHAARLDLPELLEPIARVCIFVFPPKSSRKSSWPQDAAPRSQCLPFSGQQRQNFSMPPKTGSPE